MNKACPKCKELGRDKNDDHLFLMRDGVTWCCNKTEIHPIYYERDGDTISPEDVEEKSMSIKTEDIGRVLPLLGNRDRGISKETHERYRVRTECSEETGEPVKIYYPETAGGKLVSWKVRELPKRFYVLEKEKHSGTIDLFGEHCCPKSGKKILVCAGEEDTLAAYEMLSAKYPEWDHAVVGLPRGESGSAEIVANKLELLNSFEEIVLATDMDEAGKKARAALAPLIGEKCRILLLSEKDISDMWVKGKQKEFYNAYFNAKEYRPPSIVDINDILEEAITPVPWGLSYPWPKLTELTYGLKQGGEIIGIGAAPGSGKSTIWQQIQKHMVFEHKEPIAIFDIEEGAKIGLKKLIGSVMNLPIHKPDCEYNVNEAREIGKSFDGLAHFYGGDSENWAEVDDAIRYYESKGIRFFFIDPLSALVEHLNASDANQEIGKIMRAMRKYRKHRGLTFFHANHLNNPQSGKDHGEGGTVKGSQFSGSRSQWKYSTLLMGYERDQFAEDKDERNKGVLRVIKDRLGGNTGIVNMEYNPETGLLNQTQIVEDF